MIRISLDMNKRNSEAKNTGRGGKISVRKTWERNITLYVLKYFKTVPSSQAMNRWTIYGEMDKDSTYFVNASCFAVAAYRRWFSLQHNSMRMHGYHRVANTADESAFDHVLPW